MPPTRNDTFFVHVVESPGGEDLLDGRTEGRVLVESLSLSQVPVAYNLVVSRETFDQALAERLLKAVGFFQKYPVIHLSLHGNNEGIALTDKHFITWHDLRQILLPLNDALGGSLLVCISSCFGAAGCRMAMYENQSIPFAALVGHIDSAAWNDAAVAFVTFYHRLQRGATVFDATEAMKVASGDDRFLVRMGSQVQTDYVNFLQQKRWQDTVDRLTQMMGGAGSGTPFSPGPHDVGG